MRARRSELALGVLLATRCTLEAITFACVAAGLHVATLGRDPFPLDQAGLVLFGAALALAAVLREAGTVRQTSRLIVGVVVVWVLAGTVVLPASDPYVFTGISRAIGFGILGEAFLWRSVSLTRQAVRWSGARNATAAAIAATALTLFVPEPLLDRGPLPAFGLIVVVAGGLAMAFARSAEELSLAGPSARGGTSSGTATGIALVLGVASLALAWLMPSLRVAAGAAGDALGDLLARAVYLIALPFGYLAAALVELFRPIVRDLPPIDIRPFPTSPQQEEEMRRAIEETRPFLIGAVGVIVVLVAVVVGIFLLDRMVRERRIALPAGAMLERGAADGYGFRAALAQLFPARAPRRRAPRDDGTPAGTVRLLYWRFLELAERAGAGWRATGETPAEHAARLRGADAAWAGAATIVGAFERVRYAEDAIEPAAAEEARRAFDALRRTMGRTARRETSR